MKIVFYLLFPFLLKTFIAILAPQENHYQRMQSDPSLLIPQNILQKIAETSIKLVKNTYPSFLIGSDLTKIQSTTSNKYKLTFSNNLTSYAAEFSTLPNNTIFLNDFRQIGWNVVSPLNIEQPLSTCSYAVQKLYKIKIPNLMSVNHTFINNIHNYSLGYIRNTEKYNVLVGFSLLDKTVKIYNFSAYQFANIRFDELPLNFSNLDGNLREVFKLISTVNVTGNFTFNGSTFVSFIANSISNNGETIAYYINLNTNSQILECLVTFTFPSSPRIVFVKSWKKQLLVDDDHPSINIINGWEDQQFLKVYYSLISQQQSFNFIIDIQGDKNNSSYKKIILLLKNGETSFVNY